jgi:hypothetical protein
MKDFMKQFFHSLHSALLGSCPVVRFKLRFDSGRSAARYWWMRPATHSPSKIRAILNFGRLGGSHTSLTAVALINHVESSQKWDGILLTVRFAVSEKLRNFGT